MMFWSALAPPHGGWLTSPLLSTAFPRAAGAGWSAIDLTRSAMPSRSSWTMFPIPATAFARRALNACWPDKLLPTPAPSWSMRPFNRSSMACIDLAIFFAVLLRAMLSWSTIDSMNSFTTIALCIVSSPSATSRNDFSASSDPWSLEASSLLSSSLLSSSLLSSSLLIELELDAAFAAFLIPFFAPFLGGRGGPSSLLSSSDDALLEDDEDDDPPNGIDRRSDFLVDLPLGAALESGSPSVDKPPSGSASSSGSPLATSSSSSSSSTPAAACSSARALRSLGSGIRFLPMSVPLLTSSREGHQRRWCS